MRAFIKSNLLNLFGFGAIITGLYLFLTHSKEIFDGILMGVNISVYTLLPSMYGFMILANIISNSRLKNMLSLPFSPVAKKLFKLDLELFTVYLLSLLGGYPVGAKLIADKVERGEITANDGEYMLNFCVNCSPAFLVAGVSIKLWGNSNIGLIIYFSQVITSAIIGVVLGAFKKQIISVKFVKDPKKIPLSQVVVNSVNTSTKAMVIVCSFVLFFCAFFSFVDLLPLSEKTLHIIKGFLEVCYGCNQGISSVASYDIIMICAFTAFGGVCVIMQLMALVSRAKLGLKRFLVAKVFYVILSCGICRILLNIFPQTINVFSNLGGYSYSLYSVSPIASIFLIGLGILLLSFRYGYDKI